MYLQQTTSIPHSIQLTLSRPEIGNALNTALVEELYNFFCNVNNLIYSDDKHSSLRCLIITGAGDKAFCGGADLKERQSFTDNDWIAQRRLLVDTFELIAACQIPIIASVNGMALGGGMELAIAADIIIASDQARFGLPEVKRGIIPGCGGTYRLHTRVGVGRAKKMLYTGEMISASEASQIGLVDMLVPHSELNAKTQTLVEQICANAPIAIRGCKEGLHLALKQTDPVADTEAIYWRAFHSKDRIEGITAFNEKRSAIFKNE